MGGARSSCSAQLANNATTIFNLLSCSEYVNISFSNYTVPQQFVEHISFKSRDADFTGLIRGQILNVDNFTSPTVIVVHGFRSCMRSPTVLVPAVALWQAKFNAVLLDLRNHGSSAAYQGT